MPRHALTPRGPDIVCLSGSGLSMFLKAPEVILKAAWLRVTFQSECPDYHPDGASRPLGSGHRSWLLASVTSPSQKGPFELECGDGGQLKGKQERRAFSWEEEQDE